MRSKTKYTQSITALVCVENYVSIHHQQPLMTPQLSKLLKVKGLERQTNKQKNFYKQNPVSTAKWLVDQYYQLSSKQSPCQHWSSRVCKLNLLSEFLISFKELKWFWFSEKFWARTNQLSCSYTPDPLKLCKVINIYCYFKLLNFRIAGLSGACQ